MPVITIASKKGGSGKTTLSTNIADALDHAGQRVLLVDADPQRSALMWAANASSHEPPSTIGADATLSGAKRVPQWAQDYDWVIIDCPPRHGDVLRAALSVADLVLVPIRPSPGDLEALGDTLSELERIRNARPTLPAFAIINQRPSRSSIADEVPAVIQAAGLQVLPIEIGFRADFAEAHAFGMGVCRHNPKGKAAQEMNALIAAITSTLTPAKKR
jgi:chromosome partitioning protein